MKTVIRRKCKNWYNDVMHSKHDQPKHNRGGRGGGGVEGIPKMLIASINIRDIYTHTLSIYIPCGIKVASIFRLGSIIR